jgi:hypothetical protein
MKRRQKNEETMFMPRTHRQTPCSAVNHKYLLPRSELPFELPLGLNLCPAGAVSWLEPEEMVHDVLIAVGPASTALLSIQRNSRGNNRVSRGR